MRTPRANVVSAYSKYSNSTKRSIASFIIKSDRKEVRSTIEDTCDKCFNKVLIKKDRIIKRRYGLKIYCSYCFDPLNKEENVIWCGVTSHTDEMVRKRIDKYKEEKTIPPIIYKKSNTTCKFGVVKTNGVTITPCKD